MGVVGTREPENIDLVKMRYKHVDGINVMILMDT